MGDEVDGAWAFQRFARKDDTFVHEIEIGDVDGDGDGRQEFYATPSDRNKASLESQPGGVVRVDFRDGAYEVSQVGHWTESHAKEILVADLDDDGVDELYAVREGHTRRNEDGQNELLDPVRIVRLTPGAEGWSEETFATIDDHQLRFLVPGDLNGDGRTDLLAAAFKTGLYAFLQGQDGRFEKTLVEAASSGFEHATHVADLDGDGALEIYVASDDQGELRQYVWTGDGFARKRIGTIPKQHLTWNIQDGLF